MCHTLSLMVGPYTYIGYFRILGSSNLPSNVSNEFRRYQRKREYRHRLTFGGGVYVREISP